MDVIGLTHARPVVVRVSREFDRGKLAETA
jgi:hypothetical protein